MSSEWSTARDASIQRDAGFRWAGSLGRLPFRVPVNQPDLGCDNKFLIALV